MSERFEYEFVKEYFEKEGYQLLSKEYINSKQKLKLICPNKHEYETIFSSFKRGRRCNHCCSHSYEFVKTYIEQEGYNLLSESYVGVNSKLSIMCNEGHVYEATFHKFKNGKRRCPVCKGIESSNRQRKPFEEVQKMVEEEGYKLLSPSEEYKNGETPLLVECPKRHQYKVRMSNFKTGYRCPYCNESKGEKKVADFLDKNNIPYSREVTFDDLLSNKSNKLRFDFAIFEDMEQEKLKLLIEYDGIQHSKWVKSFMTKKSFESLQYRDGLKNKYCEEKNINLLRIPHNKFENIDEILEENLL